MIKHSTSIRAVLVTIVVFVGFLVAGVPSTAALAQDCEQGFNTKVPILMVHGLNSTEDVWGDKNKPQTNSMRAALRDVRGTFLDTFDYREVANHWVSDDGIGKKLALRIDCLAQASRKGGGSGKVIVVAHSMGGLATRYASGQKVNGRKVSDELGLVVMIGTPNRGSWGGDTCKAVDWVKSNLSWCEGEAPEAMAVLGDKLKALPHFPRSVEVKTIAGSVTAVNSVFWAVITNVTKSDLLVPVSSALAEANDSGKGGGKETIGCIGILPIHGLSKAPCEHGALPNNSKVQASVKASIEAYLASVSSTVVLNGRKLVMTNLQIPTSSKWEVRGKEDYPEGNEGAVFDMTTCKRTSEGDYWKACARFFVNLGGPIQGGGNLQWWLDLCPGIKLMEKGAKVGSLKADVYKVTKCDGDFELLPYLYLWHIPGKGSIVVEPSLEGREMQGMREAFAAAVWK